MKINRENLFNGCFIFWGAVTCPVWFGPLLCYAAYENNDSGDDVMKIQPKIRQNPQKPSIKENSSIEINKCVSLPGSMPSLNQERNHLSCPICFHSDKNFQVTNPCGHPICNDCSHQMILQKIQNCPVCRTQIISFIKLYLY